MSIKIGTTILQLRKERQLTQEQLSEILGVSTTAVCKWETGATHPDIELLPVIADFFDISVDGLLGYDMCKSEANINDQVHTGVGLLNEFKAKDALAHFSKLAYRYPNQLDVLLFYAHAKGMAGEQSDNEQYKNTMRNECDELLRQCQALASKMPRKKQNKVTSDILMTYIKRKDFIKAEQILSEMDDGSYFPLDYDTGLFWLEAHRGNREQAEQKYFDLLNVIHKDIYVFARHYVFQDRPAELIKQNNKMIQVYEIFMDDFPKKPWFPLAFMHESNVVAYLKLGERDKAFYELNEFSKLMTHIPDDYPYPCKNVLRQFSLHPNFFFINSRVDEAEAYEFIKNTYENL